MPWNGSSGHVTKKVTPRKSVLSVRYYVFIMLGIAIACGIVLFSFYTEDDLDNSSLPEKRPLKKAVNIKKSQPVSLNQETTTNIIEESKWKYEEGRKLPKNAYKDERGVWRHPGGQRVFDERAPVTAHVHKPKVLFKHRSENMIGHLISIRPGASVAGTIDYHNKAFLDDFLTACKDPIEILETDTESDIALKKEMELVKKELIERYQAGENIGTILTETRKELQKIGEVTRLVEKEVKDAIRDESMTDDDVSSFIDSANKLLEKNGASPLRINPISIGNIRYNLRLRNKMKPKEEFNQ